MNQYFYESRGKEKLKELRQQGIQSQMAHKQSASKTSSWPTLSHLLIGLAAGIGLLALLIH